MSLDKKLYAGNDVDEAGERLSKLDQDSRKRMREAYQGLSEEIKKRIRKHPKYGWIYRAVRGAC